MRSAAAAVSTSSRTLVAQAARNRQSSRSTAVVAAAVSMPSSRFPPAAPRLSTALRVSAFQSATAPSTPRPAMASASPVPVRIRVCKRVPFGHTIAVVGVGSPALGGWEVGNSRAVLTWTDGDVWSGEVVAERGATLEYKLVALDGAGNPADWQLGENRVVEVKGNASAISVEESWEGGGEVEVRVEEEEEEKKVVAAAPVANAPAPAAFVQKPAVAVSAAVPKPAAAATPAPKPWAAPVAAAAAPVAAAAAAPATAAASSSPSASPSKALSALTVPQLKAKLKASGLPTTGKKAELVARLEKGA